MTEPTTINNNASDPGKVAAEIAKLEAETRKLTDEADLAKLDQELRRQEIRETKAKADEAESEAVIRALALKDRLRQEDLVQVQDHYAFHHLFDEAVSAKSVYNCLNTLVAWDRQYPECPMNITMNSPGGDVVSGFHLFDALSAYSLRGNGTHKVTITVRGYAASMAGILLQAADERVVGPRSFMLCHEVSSWAEGTMGQIKDRVEWLKKMSDQVVDIFIERSEGKISREEFQAGWTRRDWWLSAGEVINFGFADRIG